MFIKKEKPYCFIGASYWYGTVPGSAGSYGNRERLIRKPGMIIWMTHHMKSRDSIQYSTAITQP
ncbi:MAG: hypothetical protein ACLFN1_08470 [Bacteroidales bacterium]